MTTIDERVVIQESSCDDCCIKAVTVHHRDYPEAVVEAPSVAEGMENLARLLARALENVDDNQHRMAVRQALDEVRDYAERLERLVP